MQGRTTFPSGRSQRATAPNKAPSASRYSQTCGGGRESLKGLPSAFFFGHLIGSAAGTICLISDTGAVWARSASVIGVRSGADTSGEPYATRDPPAARPHRPRQPCLRHRCRRTISRYPPTLFQALRHRSLSNVQLLGSRQGWRYRLCAMGNCTPTTLRIYVRLRATAGICFPGRASLSRVALETEFRNA